MLELLYTAARGSLGSLTCDQLEINGDSVYLHREQTATLAARYDGWAFILEPGLLADGTPLRQSALTIKVAVEPDGAPLEASAAGQVVASDEHGFRLRALTTAKAVLCDASGQAGLLSKQGQIWQVLGGSALAGPVLIHARSVVSLLGEPLGPRSRLSSLAA